MAVCRYLEFHTGVCTSPDVYGPLHDNIILNEEALSSGRVICQARIVFSILKQIEEAQTGKRDLGDDMGKRVCLGYESS